MPNYAMDSNASGAHAECHAHRHHLPCQPGEGVPCTFACTNESQLLQGGYRSEGGSPRSSAPQAQAAAAAQQQRTHSRNNSRGMMHLPEEAPLSEAAIRILDSSLPSLLGRTHHTHIGVAVPLSTFPPSLAM